MACSSELGLRDGDLSKVGCSGHFCVWQQVEICFVSQGVFDGNTIVRSDGE